MEVIAILKSLFTLQFLAGYRTIFAAVAAIGSGIVMCIDGNATQGMQSIALGLGLLGIRYKGQ